jgi:hypothetical protein
MEVLLSLNIVKLHRVMVGHNIDLGSRNIFLYTFEFILPTFKTFGFTSFYRFCGAKETLHIYTFSVFK